MEPINVAVFEWQKLSYFWHKYICSQWGVVLKMSTSLILL